MKQHILYNYFITTDWVALVLELVILIIVFDLILPVVLNTKVSITISIKITMKLATFFFFFGLGATQVIKN